MASFEDLLLLLRCKEQELDYYGQIYEDLGDPRAPTFKAQYELLDGILRDLDCWPSTTSKQSLSAVKRERVEGRVAAFLTEARGPMTATLFPSWQEAMEAYHRFKRENEGIEMEGVNFEHEAVDLAYLSPEVLSQPGPHIVHSLITVVRGGWEISLHHHWKEADALYEQLKVEEAYDPLVDDDIWVGWPPVALTPQLTQIIIEDLQVYEERRLRTKG